MRPSMKRFITLLFAAIVIVSLIPAGAQAMPNFARRYDLPCVVCHTVIPRLNETGFKFRAAGFRMPAEIGVEEKKISLYPLHLCALRHAAPRPFTSKYRERTMGPHLFQTHAPDRAPASDRLEKLTGCLNRHSDCPKQ